MRNLAKTSNLSVSMVRPFLHSKLSYTQFTLATRKFNRLKAFARFKNEVWCMDLAHVDNLGKDKKGVSYLLVRQDLYNGTVNAKRMKTKDSKKLVRSYLTMSTKRNRTKKIWVDEGTNLLESFNNFAKLKENKFTPKRVSLSLHLLKVLYDP